MKRKMLFCQNYGTNLATNLVAYYAFEGNANDSINAHNGTLVGSPTFPSGKHNLGINFGNDGVSRYVDISDNDDFSFTNGTNDVPFSISMWVNFTAFNSTGNWLINKRGSTVGSDEWQFLYFGGIIRIALLDYIGSGYLIVGFPFSTLNTWVHLAATYNGVGNTSITGLKLYLNGVEQVTTNSSSGTYTKMPNGNHFVRLGLNSWSNSNIDFKHKGLLDELAIWKNRELTSAEVLELYNSGAGKFHPF